MSPKPLPSTGCPIRRHKAQRVESASSSPSSTSPMRNPQGGTVVYLDVDVFAARNESIAAGCARHCGPLSIPGGRRTCRLREPFGTIWGATARRPAADREMLREHRFGCSVPRAHGCGRGGRDSSSSAHCDSGPPSLEDRSSSSKGSAGSVPDLRAAPDVEDVRCALLVVPPVGATRRDEPMPLVEPLGARV